MISLPRLSFFTPAAGIALAALLTLLTACAAPPAPECRNPDILCAGLVTDVGGLNDASLNEQVWQILQEARTENVIVAAIASVDARDYAKNIAYFGERNYDLILTSGRAPAQEAILLAGKYPHSDFVLIGQAPPADPSLPNVAGILFPEEQAGQWAGALATHLSQTGRVGAVFAHPEIPSVAAYARGFAAGAGEARVDMVFYEDGSFSSSLSDPAWGAEKARWLNKRGADVLFAFGGSTGISALEHATGRVVAVEIDVARRFPYFQSNPFASIIFDVSVLKEILRAGEITQPVYWGGYEVIWHDAPAPQVLAQRER
jgi:basic membrane protein A and related proteins